jgi:hypothetical protein
LETILEIDRENLLPGTQKKIFEIDRENPEFLRKQPLFQNPGCWVPRFLKILVPPLYVGNVARMQHTLANNQDGIWAQKSRLLRRRQQSI